MNKKLASQTCANFIINEWDTNYLSTTGFCSHECANDYAEQFNADYFEKYVQILDVSNNNLNLVANGCEHPA